MITKLCAFGIPILLVFGNVVVFVASSEETQPVWPTSWIPADTDPNEAGSITNYRDIHLVYYASDESYLYFRFECFDAPNLALEPESRYKCFIDTDDPHNMAWQGGNVHDAEFLLFVEDSPKPGGDGRGDVYLLPDVDGDGFIGDDWPNYLSNPGPILDTSIAGYRIINQCLDIYVRQTAIGTPIFSYFTWSTDQEDPNLDATSTTDRSDSYWNETLSKADIGIMIADSADIVYPGDPLTYSLQVTNHGPLDVVNIYVSDILTDAVTFLDAVPAQDGVSSHILWWNLTSLTVGASVKIQIHVAIKNDTDSGVITNYAGAYSNTYDPMPGNNEVLEETTVGLDTDDDGIPDSDDSDDDNDGYSDVNETACGSDPQDNQSVPSDFDGDFIPDCVDPDDDTDDGTGDNTNHDDNNGGSGSNTPLDNNPATDGNNTSTGNDSIGITSLGIGNENNDTLNSSYSPLSSPSITGPSEGYTDIFYNFSIISHDSDVDVKFIIDWGDGTSNESDYLTVGSVWIILHKWIHPGQYILSVTAFDRQTNATTNKTIIIDTPNIPRVYTADAGNVLFILLALLFLPFLILYYLRRKRKKDETQEDKK